MEMENKMKILVVADGIGEEIYDRAFYEALLELGHDAHRFTWKEYYRHYQYSNRFDTDGNKIKSLFYRIQNRFIAGPVTAKINSDLIKRCKQLHPDLVFIYRGTHIYPSTIRRIQKTGALVFGYNNDDPFSPKYPRYFWRHFRRSIPFYDHIFAYRWKNIDDYHRMGYHKTSLLRSYYLKKNDFRSDAVQSAYACDVIFIGHFENDGRDLAIKALLDAGIDLKLFGTGWETSYLHDFFIQRFGAIKPLYHEEYNKALNSGKIALVFLSKLNNDTYTRRCFEIPATGTMMMAEYTTDLAGMFEEGKEAEFFRNHDELVEKTLRYIRHPEQIAEVGSAGYARLLADGHEVTDRAASVVEQYHHCKGIN